MRMTRNRSHVGDAAPHHPHRGVTIVTAVLVSALAGSPGTALASSLLSGYGGPGEGSEAILGSTLVNGPPGGAGGGSVRRGRLAGFRHQGARVGVRRVAAPANAPGCRHRDPPARGGSEGAHHAPAAPAMTRPPRERGRRGRPSPGGPPTETPRIRGSWPDRARPHLRAVGLGSAGSRLGPDCPSRARQRRRVVLGR